MPKNIQLLVNETEDRYARENFRRLEKYVNQDQVDARRFLADSVLDFANSYIRHTILTAATTLSIRNPKLNKTVILECTGNYTLSIPDGTITSGTYDGTKTNWLYIHCVDEVTPTYVIRIETAP